MNVIVLDILTQDQPQMPLTVMSIRSGHSRRALEIHRSATAFARGARMGVLMIRTPTAANTESTAAVNLASCPDREFVRREVDRLCAWVDAQTAKGA